MAYESIKDTPVLDRVERKSNKLFGFAAHLIGEARPGINQRRELLHDVLNDSRLDGTIIKTLAKC